MTDYCPVLFVDESIPEANGNLFLFGKTRIFLVCPLMLAAKGVLMLWWVFEPKEFGFKAYSNGDVFFSIWSIN